MSTRRDTQRLLTWKKQAQTETNHHFAADLKQLPVNCRELGRLEQGLAVLALAANMAAAKPAETIIEMNDGTNWYKSVELMTNISLCHRPIPEGVEYAVTEYFSAQDTNEIWNRGGNAMEVLRGFISEQRQALKIWVDEMTVQIKGFLSAKYPDQNINRLAHDFMDRFLTGQFAGRQF